MALNSTDSQSTALVSWIPHLRSAPLRWTPIGRSYRASHSKPIYAPSIHLCFQLNVIFLFRALIRTHRYYGLRVAKLTWTVREKRQQWSDRGFLLNCKWKEFLWSLPNTVQRMYWHHILRHSPMLLKFRMWTHYKLVQHRMKLVFPSSRKNIEQSPSKGETHDIT